MNTKLFLRGTVAALTCLSLGACLGNGNGGGGLAGGPAGGGTYQANVDRVQGLGPQTVRQAGVVNYQGKTRLETVAANSSTLNGYFIGDLAFAADFDNDTFNGTATNFAGEVDGTPVTLAGTLSSSNTADPNIVVQTDIVVPVVGGTVTTGSLIGNMRGTLTESVDNQTADAQLVVTGSFFGTNATGAGGGATMLLNNTGGVGFTFGGAGTFYADRQ